MIRTFLILFICIFSFHPISAQDFGNYPSIKKEKLLNDLELLYQGLDKFHSGMYWYTPKDSVDNAFQAVKNKITHDLNVFEFYKLIAPLVALSQEAHTNIRLPINVRKRLNSEAKFMPMTFVFLGKELYCVKNGSDFQGFPIEGKRVELINGKTPISIADKTGSLLSTDGFIKTAIYSYLEGFSFSEYYFYYYGQVDQFEIKFKEIKEPVIVKSLSINGIKKHLNNRYKNSKAKDLLEYKILNDSIAYLGVHSFSNSDMKEESKEKNFKTFLKNSFKSIKENKIRKLIIDVSENGGGTEGNEGLLYSYLGENYQKYKKVRIKTQKAILDNGIDQPIQLKTFGFFERIFLNKKNKDGSLERREWIGHGLKAYKKEPKNKFSGKTYVIISPVTYSAGSEFSNMVYTNDLATFVGQETGGGYFGNTSGYSQELVLPNSKIEIEIPALQFMMNVEEKLPFGSGVIPHHEVIPTFETYTKGENESLKYILEVLENGFIHKQ